MSWKGTFFRPLGLLYLFIFAQNGNRSQQTQHPLPSLAECMTPRGHMGPWMVASGGALDRGAERDV